MSVQTELCGLMLDSARCQENRAYYRNFIRFAADRGVNILHWHFTDDQGCTLQFDSVPALASPHAYSKTEMRELIAFARENGITIIPELASLGHTRYITRLEQFNDLDEIEHVFTGICPVSPRTREILAQLVAETAEVFDAPWIHAGLDEANIGNHPLTKKALATRSRGEIVADHINFMHEQISRHGRKMMMWGDSLLHDRQITDHISRDIIICNWQYGAQVDGASTQYFLDKGFPVVLCPALISHEQPVFPGDQLAISNLRSLLQHRSRTGKGKILGTIETIWQPERYMHDSLWIGIDLAIAMIKEGPDVSIEDCTRNFAKDFYGVTPSEKWVAACREIYQRSPLRRQWLPEFKMELEKLPAQEELNESTRAWQRIADVLNAEEPHVQKNQQAYRTFCLMVELIAHAYRKADLLTGPPINSDIAREILDDERQLLQQVDAVWDHERFADDPRKRSAIREYFSDDCLLATLRSMLMRTESLLNEKMHKTEAKKLEVSIHVPKRGPGITLGKQPAR
ncbi:MAG TPA: family 20 glycosylhydrolase [Tepidisphaeraceae bacterium]|nr:family 20 glycosylhydrolase [Tepidisphaeraceae bacterium]